MQSPVQFGLIDVAYSTCDIFCIFEIQILYSTLARMVRYWSIGFGFFFSPQALQTKNICIPHGNKLFLYKTMLIWQKNIFV